MSGGVPRVDVQTRTAESNTEIDARERPDNDHPQRIATLEKQFLNRSGQVGGLQNIHDTLEQHENEMKRQNGAS